MAMAWKKLVSSQRKRAVMACFRMVPLYNLPRHRAINLFLKAYSTQWLQKEQPGHRMLIENITVCNVSAIHICVRVLRARVEHF